MVFFSGRVGSFQGKRWGRQLKLQRSIDEGEVLGERVSGLARCVFWGGEANGQTTGEMRGAVKDPLGAIIQGASVTATLGGTDTTRTVLTDQDGDFDVPELPIGTYSVTAEVQGFKKYLAKEVIISIGHVTVVNMTLQIGVKSETVMVVANATQVETTSTQIGAVMTDASVRELPLSTRNTYELLQLQPGVQSQLGADLFYGSDNPGVVSVNGGRGRSNNYMVNGGDGNDIFVNGPAIQPTPDAIEEFRVLTNTFDAEYGRNSGPSSMWSRSRGRTTFMATFSNSSGMTSSTQKGILMTRSPITSRINLGARSAAQ